MSNTPPTRPARPAARRSEPDLSLGAAYHGPSFADAEWDWLSVVRAAIYLCDYMTAHPDRQPRPLLPGRVGLNKLGQLRVDEATPAEAAFFTAPEIVEAATPAARQQETPPARLAAPTAAVYHIGALAYYLLAGRPPVGDIADMERDAPAAPDALKDVLLRSLAVDPARRPPTPADLRARLYFVLFPPAWFEESIPRLPLDDGLKTRLIGALTKAQHAWYGLRDQLPWQQLGKARRWYVRVLDHPEWGDVLRVAGVALLVLIYLLLLTDVI